MIEIPAWLSNNSCAESNGDDLERILTASACSGNSGIICPMSSKSSQTDTEPTPTATTIQTRMNNTSDQVILLSAADTLGTLLTSTEYFAVV